MTLTKAHIIENIQKQNGFTKKRATAALETLLELIKQSLENGGEVLISGFGKYTVQEKKARRGRNPATGKDLILKPRRVVKFKISDRLSERFTDYREWIVYLIRCSDGSLYCGVTKNIEQRILMHNSGKGSKYTRSRRPVELVASSTGMSKSDAIKLEKRIKRVPASKKLLELRRGDGKK
jgi:integration host factor subunit alpha